MENKIINNCVATGLHKLIVERKDNLAFLSHTECMHYLFSCIAT